MTVKSTLQKLGSPVAYPNVTHDGVLMNDNIFFPTQEEAAQTAYRNFVARVENVTMAIVDRERQLEQLRTRMAEAYEAMSKLPQNFPGVDLAAADSD